METQEPLGEFAKPGYLAIEFQHTETGPSADPMEGPLPLHDYDDLLAWGRSVGVLSEPEAQHLRRLSRRDRGGAGEAYTRALRIRDNLDDVFRAIALGGLPSTRATAALAVDEAEALAHADIVGGPDGFEWSWANDKALARPLWPVIHDATRLLIDGPLERIKACDGCRYLFVDESKNRSRRWCSMATCGTAEKMRRFVKRRAAKRGT